MLVSVPLGRYGLDGHRLETATREKMDTRAPGNTNFVLAPWEDVDLEANELRLRDSKTGARTVLMAPSAARILAGLPRFVGNPWVIPGKEPGTHRRNLDDLWKTIRLRAGLDDVRLHDICQRTSGCATLRRPTSLAEKSSRY